MVIEITDRDGQHGYVQVRASEHISGGHTISNRQARRVLRELRAPVGDGLLSGRYVAMRMANKEQIPMTMEPERGGLVLVRDARR